jgi:hypothetical protein
MKTMATGVCALAVVVTALWAADVSVNSADRAAAAVAKGAKWLASVQGADGGWGQDGGETSYVRQGERLESNGNDVANTAAAALALRRSGKQYQTVVNRAVEYVLKNVETAPQEGLTVTKTSGTQIQRKLGPYIDTFLASKLLSEIDGGMQTTTENLRVRKALEKCVAKIESNQLKDGSWNVAGGWAPILGTSLASQSLFVAQKKGVAVDQVTMARTDTYTKQSAGAGGGVAGSGGGFGGGVGTLRATSGASTVAVSAASAGVPLYQSAQALEQLSRTEKDRKDNAPQIAAIKQQFANPRFVEGFGSMGGEEFFSYLNISDSLKRTGGPEYAKWRDRITARILGYQNADGTWAGSHCITGRVATTSAAILNLVIDNSGDENK